MLKITNGEIYQDLFQFQDGSIKCWDLSAHQVELIRFQFQDGSIKWEFPNISGASSAKFQFQDGSIKCDISVKKKGC